VELAGARGADADLVFLKTRKERPGVSAGTMKAQMASLPIERSRVAKVRNQSEQSRLLIQIFEPFRT